MKAELILGAYIGLQKAILRVEACVKQAVKDVIAASDEKIKKVRSKAIQDELDYDKAMDKIAQKHLDKVIKNSNKVEKINKRKSELQKLL